MNEPQTAPQAVPVAAEPAPQGVPVPQSEPVAANPVPAANPAPQVEPVAAPANPVPQTAPAVEPDYRAMYENLRRENEILRHNAEMTQRAPVQGVSGGGSVAAPVDDFIRGFDSDTWGD